MIGATDPAKPAPGDGDAWRKDRGTLAAGLVAGESLAGIGLAMTALVGE